MVDDSRTGSCGGCAGPRDRSSNDERPPQLPDPKSRCCRGLLYFSQAMLETNAMPVSSSGLQNLCALSLQELSSWPLVVCRYRN